MRAEHSSCNTPQRIERRPDPIMRTTAQRLLLAAIVGGGALAAAAPAQAQQTTYHIAVWLDQATDPGFVEIGGLNPGTIVTFELTAPGGDPEERSALAGSDRAARVFGVDLDTPLIEGTRIVARDQTSAVLGEYTVEALTAEWHASTGVLSGTAAPGSELRVARWPVSDPPFVVGSEGSWNVQLDAGLTAALGGIEIHRLGSSGTTILPIISEPALPMTTIGGVEPVGVSLWVVPATVPVGSMFQGFVEAGGDLDKNGCTLASTIDGAWVVFVPGAPLFVNQGWFDVYAVSVPAGSGFLSVCP
jgi:hypothetical protein